MSTCKWDRDKADYLNNGEPCRYDEHGDRTYHCQARRTCSQHVARGELTCARHLWDTRQDIRIIRDQAPLAYTEALGDGVNSLAAVIAGPAANYDTFSTRRSISRRWILTNIPNRKMENAIKALLEDDDEIHPFSVLTRWHWMVSAIRGDNLPEVMTLTNSADYLDRVLNVIAQDETQEFARMAREIKKCRNTLINVLHNSTAAERGAPCPTCVAAGNVDPKTVRLRCDYGHWCLDEDCELVHHIDAQGDTWTCPRDKTHVWSEREYRNYVEERKSTA